MTCNQNANLFDNRTVIGNPEIMRNAQNADRYNMRRTDPIANFTLPNGDRLILSPGHWAVINKNGELVKKLHRIGHILESRYLLSNGAELQTCSVFNSIIYPTGETLRWSTDGTVL